MENDKRNEPHIRRVAELSDQIFALKSAVTEDADWDSVKTIAVNISKDIRSLYSNREMALVCTKLDEVKFWAEEKDIEQTRAKLTEARGWCLNYIDTLKTS